MVVGMGALANTTPPPTNTVTFTFFDSVLAWFRDLFPTHSKPRHVVNCKPAPRYELPGYPDGGPFVGEPLSCYHRRKWEELDPGIRGRAVATARGFLSVELAEDARRKMEADPDSWMGDFHHGAGTWIRNELRHGVHDHELPTGNWDDYYVCAVEAAVGGPEEVDDPSWEATRRREEVSKQRSNARFAEELREHGVELFGGPPSDQ
jgi:hypothetical protein